jgi:hypothetical protein
MSDNSSVLVIGDTHAPYHHRDALDFLAALAKRYKPDRVVHIGDEVDLHSTSYHEHNPDLPSPGDEHKLGRKFLHTLHGMFPKMDLMQSNHGSLYARKRITAGLPEAVFKTDNEIWGVGAGWKWHFDLRMRLPSGEECYFHHSKGGNILQVSQAMGMSTVAGHLHEKCGVQYWGTPGGLHFAAQTGCLVDWHSMAMAYARNNLKRPVLGSLVIVDGFALSIPMVLNDKGRWTKQLPEKGYVKIR